MRIPAALDRYVRLEVSGAVEALTRFATMLSRLRVNAYGTLRSRGVPHWLAKWMAYRWPARFS